MRSFSSDTHVVQPHFHNNTHSWTMCFFSVREKKHSHIQICAVGHSQKVTCCLQPQGILELQNESKISNIVNPLLGNLALCWQCYLRPIRALAGPHKKHFHLPSRERAHDISVFPIIATEKNQIHIQGERRKKRERERESAKWVTDPRENEGRKDKKQCRKNCVCIHMQLVSDTMHCMEYFVWNPYMCISSEWSWLDRCEINNIKRHHDLECIV